MAKIRQADILSGAVSFTKSSTFAITTTVVYAQSNLTKSAFSIGTVAGMGATDPIAIKEQGDGNTNWSDEQDWTIYNQSFTTTIPVSNVAGGVAVYTTSTNASISIGDLVGIYGPGTWSLSSGVLNQPYRLYLASAGSQRAALVAGGSTGSGDTSTTELFNGATWVVGSNLSIAKEGLIGAGSQNAALVAGGITSAITNATELFNGATWSTSGVLSVAKQLAASAGSQNAALVAGGITSAITNATELFNGATWSTSGVLSVAKQQLAGAGSQNAGLVAGGLTSGSTNVTELFNGSAWTIGGILSIAKYASGGIGSQNAAMVVGGVTVGTSTNVTELFNGSSWSASGTLSSPNVSMAATGSQSAGMAAAGFPDSGGGTVTQLHNQTLFRKIVNSADLKNANSIGVAFDVSSTTLSIKFNGYINNINVSSSNALITTVDQWTNKWVVLPRFAPNASTTNNPSSVVSKTTTDPEDFLVGYAISRTQMQVFSGNLYSLDRINRW